MHHLAPNDIIPVGFRRGDNGRATEVHLLCTPNGLNFVPKHTTDGRPGGSGYLNVFVEYTTENRVPLALCGVRIQGVA